MRIISSLLLAAVVSQRDVLKWKKDFISLFEAYSKTQALDVISLAERHERFEKAFNQLIKNFQHWMEYSVFNKPVSRLFDDGKSPYRYPLHEPNSSNKKSLANQIKELSKRIDDLFHHRDPSSALYNMFRYLDVEENMESPGLNQTHGWYKLPKYQPFILRTQQVLDEDPDKWQWYSRMTDLSYDRKEIEKLAFKLFETVRTYIGLLGEGKKGAKEIVNNNTVPASFDSFGMVFVNEAFISSDTIPDLLQAIHPSLDRLRKLFPSVFYGTIYLLPKEGYTFVLKNGSGDAKAAAHYTTGTDEIHVFCRDYRRIPKSLGTLLVHELGHRIYRKKLTSSQRGQWVDLFDEKDAASAYGATDPEEDFCETLALYINEKVGAPIPSSYQFAPPSRDRFQKLESVLGRQLTASVFKT